MNRKLSSSEPSVNHKKPNRQLQPVLFKIEYSSVWTKSQEEKAIKNLAELIAFQKEKGGYPVMLRSNGDRKQDEPKYILEICDSYLS